MTTTILARRFNAHVTQGPFIVESASGGILLLATALQPDEKDKPFALCLVLDLNGLGRVNHGASATNAMGKIVAHWAADIAAFAGCPVRRIMWVEMDSMGAFNHAFPAWPPGDDVFGIAPTRVNWAPLRSPSRGAGSAEAFMALWEPYGRALLAHATIELGDPQIKFHRKPAR